MTMRRNPPTFWERLESLVEDLEIEAEEFDRQIRSVSHDAKGSKRRLKKYIKLIKILKSAYKLASTSSI